MAEKVKITKGTKIQQIIISILVVVALLAGIVSFLDTPSSKKKSTKSRPAASSPF